MTKILITSDIGYRGLELLVNVGDRSTLSGKEAIAMPCIPKNRI